MIYKVNHKIKLKPIIRNKSYKVDIDAYDKDQTVKDIEKFEKEIIIDSILSDNILIQYKDIESVIVNVEIINQVPGAERLC